MVILQYTFQRSKKKGLKSGIHMEKLSKWIVKFRNVILVVAILLLIPSVYGYLKTDINYDLLSYLPASSESMKAQDIPPPYEDACSSKMLIETCSATHWSKINNTFFHCWMIS